MIRIFQTGDNHIGIRYSKYDEADRMRSERLESLAVCVNIANDNKCNLFAVTGDLFDSVKVSKRDVKKTVEILSKFNGEQVVVLPGNHDYYDGTTEVWENFESYLSDNDKIKLLKAYKPFSFDVDDERVMIYPAYCDALHSDINKLDWIKDRDLSMDDADYRIGIAHGAIEGLSLDDEGRYFLMTEEELLNIPVNVWLVGHTHVSYPKTLDENSFTSGYKVFNAGTHCQTDVSNNTDGCAFIIELDGDNSPSAKKVHTGTLRFYRDEIQCIPASDGSQTLEAQLTQAVRNYGDLSVVESALVGSVVNDDYEQRSDIYKKVFGRFLEYKCTDKDLSKLLNEELIKAEFNEKSLSAQLLLGLLNDPTEAQLAYDLIRSLKL